MPTTRFSLATILYLALVPLVEAQIANQGIPSTRSVVVRTAKVRKSPQYWAAASGEVVFGQTVEILANEGDTPGWLRVASPQGAGYLPLGTLSEKRVVFPELTAASRPIAPIEDGSTIVLAGKGFNQGLEKNYLVSTGISAEALDHLEALQVKDAELLAFIDSGELTR